MNEFESYVLASIMLKAPKSLIDLGCATGDMLNWIYVNAGIQNVVGIDIAKPYIKEGRKRHPYLKLRVCDVRKLPFQDKVFDISFTHGLFIHIRPSEIKRALIEATRIARHSFFVESSGKEVGGKMVDSGEYWNERAKHPNYKKDDSKIQYYFSHDYLKLFKELNLDCQVIKEFDPTNKTRLYSVWQKQAG